MGYNVPWSSQSETVKLAEPAFAALAQALCWIAQLLWRAAPEFTKVSPLTVKGLLLAESLVTGGAAPPKVPVKAWTFVPVAAPVEVLPSVAPVVPVELVEFVEAATFAPEAEEEEVLLVDAVDPLATAAVISAAVASATRRFWLIMQPTVSLASSQVLPLPVLSLFCIN